jgi:hypothetical protein
MRKVLLFIVTVLTSLPIQAQEEVLLILDSLDRSIAHKQQYDHQKEKQTDMLKQWLKNSSTLQETYDLSTRLYEIYQKYQIDSAIVYAEKAVKIASTIGNPDYIYSSRLKLVVLYSSSGMFREAESLLKEISKKNLPSSLMADYYNGFRLFFNYYSVNVNVRSIEYQKKKCAYRDSLMEEMDPSSVQYDIHLSEKLIEDGEIYKAREVLTRLLGNASPENPDYAMITFLMGLAEETDGNIAQSKKYYALSAINDIQNATKDNSSIHHLANFLYNEGDIERAFRYSQIALNDALFCNVQFRTFYLTQFFTIINANYKEKIEKQRSKLMIYLFLISMLSLFLIVAVIYVYKQMDKVSRIRQELDGINKELIRLNCDISKKNDQLNERNALLLDSNQIKEEYIAHFFNLCSKYINKLEDYRKSLNKLAVKGEHKELFSMLKSNSVIENEVEELYRNFDTIFLNLYPAFVEEFNTLLTDEEKSEPKNGEKLNTELRIFALIRLGITDSVKIASFLRYSLSTIYNYRTRARNRAAVSRDEFEEQVMKIGTIIKN